jgi:hypothetical protein
VSDPESLPYELALTSPLTLPDPELPRLADPATVPDTVEVYSPERLPLRKALLELDAAPERLPLCKALLELDATPDPVPHTLEDLLRTGERLPVTLALDVKEGLTVGLSVTDASIVTDGDPEEEKESDILAEAESDAQALCELDSLAEELLLAELLSLAVLVRTPLIDPEPLNELTRESRGV